MQKHTLAPVAPAHGAWVAVECGEAGKCVVLIAQDGIARIAEGKKTLDPGGLGITLHNFNQARRLFDRWRKKQKRVDKREDSCVRAEAQCKRNEHGERKSWRFAQLAQGITHVGTDGFKRWPLPDFAAALLKHRAVAKDAAGSSFCFFAAHAFAHQLLGSFLKMEAHLFGEIVVEGAATEDSRNPTHRMGLSVCGAFAGIQDERDALEHAFEA